MLRIYIASKLHHAGKFIKIERQYPEFLFTNRWQYIENKVEDSAEEAIRFWQLDHADVKLANLTIVYGEADDKLRGALIEAGMALAFGQKVFVVGNHPDFGTWQYHPQVRRVETVEKALGSLKTFGL